MQQAPPTTTVRITVNLSSPKPTESEKNPGTEGASPDLFDKRTLSTIRDLVQAFVRGDHMREERKDCLQETLIHLSEIVRANPGWDAASRLLLCRGFIRDRLKRGRSVDSPKRRRFGRSIDATDFWLRCDNIPQLVSNSNPYHYASARDAIKQLRVRLDSRDQEILSLFLEGNGAREVARRLCICASVVSKGTRRIRAVALKLGLKPGATRRPKKKNEKK